MGNHIQARSLHKPETTNQKLETLNLKSNLVSYNPYL